MRILFVCSGNSKNFKVAPFIKSQGDSLQEHGIEVQYFLVKGKGLWGYLKAGFKLRSFLKNNHFDLIHAHFSLSGWAAVIGGGRIPIILSLMGDDAQGDYIGVNKITFKSRFFMLSTLIIQPFVDVIISKSKNLENFVYLKNKSFILPNGINTTQFNATGHHFRKELGLIEGKQYVLFLGSQKRIGKNYPLAEKAVASLALPHVALINPFPVPHDDIPKYLNSVDVLVLPSFMEGSPNVIKEAMACNCPIVATNVGDTGWVMGDTAGCYLATHDVADFSDKIKAALQFAKENGRTNGEKRIQQLGLDTSSIALKLIDIYRKTIPQTTEMAFSDNP